MKDHNTDSFDSELYSKLAEHYARMAVSENTDPVAIEVAVEYKKQAILSHANNFLNLKKANKSENKKKKLRFAKYGLSAAAAIVLAVYLIQSETTKNLAELQINSGQVLLNHRPYQNQRIRSGDIIESSGQAILTIANLKILMLSNSKLEIKQLHLDRPRHKIAIRQLKGLAFHSLKPKTTDYSVFFQKNSITVTGTKFLLESSNQNSSITMLTGSVKLKSNKKNLKIWSGKKAILKKNKVTLQKMTEAETEILQELDTSVYIEKRDKIKDDTFDKKNLHQVNNKKKMAKSHALAKLKKKHGSIFKVSTKNGKTYIGVFKAAGELMTITTVGGSKVVIRSAIVAKVIPYR